MPVGSSWDPVGRKIAPLEMQVSEAEINSRHQSKERLEFIDLFAGLGGFHLALRRFGHRAVFACEIDPDLQRLYQKNFGLQPAGDIREIQVYDIARHDILCAGFPCQPFSKAGAQQGFNCPRWGDLFAHVLRIIEHHKPRFILIENVPNLERHDCGRTWKKVQSDLKAVGYEVKHARLSPHHFGIPQIRDRLFIVASRSKLEHFLWPEKTHEPAKSIASFLESDPPDASRISPRVKNCLDVWRDFLDQFPKDRELASFPIWSMEFGATCPYEHGTPYATGLDELGKYAGSQGISLAMIPASRGMEALPSYARTKQEQFPDWKVRFVRQNRDFYQENRAWIDRWMPKILEFPPSLQKLEWNCKGEERDIWKFIIQFRASGVRIKRPTTAPSLIAMTTTQVPSIGWKER